TRWPRDWSSDVCSSDLITGDVVSKLTVEEANTALTEKKKRIVKYNQLLLGITKASLSTDSFLSAASFQDTTRVLIAAATSGKVEIGRASCRERVKMTVT